MAIEVGKDYAYARKVTWVFGDLGVGKAFVVLTREQVVIFPYDTVGGSGNTMTSSTTTIGGRPPAEVIEELLVAPSTSAESLNAQLTTWCGQISGALRHSLDAYKRIKLRAGWFNRGVRMSQKEKGFDSGFGTAIAFRPTKEEMEGFFTFFEGDSRLS